MTQTFSDTVVADQSPERVSTLEAAYLFQLFRSMSEKYNLAHYGMMAHPDELEELSDVDVLARIALNVAAMEPSTMLILVNDHKYEGWGDTDRMQDAEYEAAFAALQLAVEQRIAELGMQVVNEA